MLGMCVLRLLPFRPYFAPATPGDWTPNLTMILITTDHYTHYPKYCPWYRAMHSPMAVHHLDSCTALWLSACCSPHVHVHFMHSPMAIHLMSTKCLPHDCLMLTSWQSLHHAYRTASHLGTSCISSPLHLHSITPIYPHARPMFPSCYTACIPHGLHSFYRVWSTYLGYSPHGSLMYYSIGYL